MDEPVTGKDELKEPEPDKTPPAVEKPPVAEEPPAGEKPPSKRNWMLIALIAVSCVAVLLLAATITLAVTGGYCHHRVCERFERFEGRQMRPMPWRGDEERRRGFPRAPWDSAPLPQTQSAPAPQTQSTPTPGQGP